MWLDEVRAVAHLKGRMSGLKTGALVAAAMGNSLLRTYVRQDRFSEPRPFQMDDSITLVGAQPHTSSYPSGHTRTAFAAARVLATLHPDRAARVYDLAHQVGISRVYAGAHLPSDVLAGARLGVAAADQVLRAVSVSRP